MIGMPKIIEVKDEEDAVSELVAMLGQRRFVRVDGHSGHGKSRVAKALANELGWHRVEVDQYLDGKPRNRRRYYEMVDRVRLAEALRNAQGGVVLDGVCLDQIVTPESHGPELRVYMRSYFAPEFDADERRRQAKLGTDRYHREFDPANPADVIITKLALDF
jgi:hypothetical protein